MANIRHQDIWLRDILQHIEDNDNTNVLPQINLVFDNDSLPIISDHVDHNNVYIYQDILGYEKLPNNIFIPINETSSMEPTHGSIITDSFYIDDNHHISIPQTTYICGPILPPPTNGSIEDCISSSIKSTNSTGLYELNINIHVQNDSGANRSVTNLISLLHDFQQIQPYPIAGVNSDTPAIYCSGFGYLKWYSEDKQLILVPCYYCDKASGTIISPTDIVYWHRDNFVGWQMTTNLDKKTGSFTLLARDGVNHITYPTFM